jgi:hypothetical protein
LRRLEGKEFFGRQRILYIVSVSGINGNKRTPLKLIGSDFGTFEAERSSFVSIHTAHAYKRETCGDAGREW